MNTQTDQIKVSQRRRELTRIMQAIFINTVTCVPAFEELLLWIPYQYPEYQIGNYIAYATERKMYFQERFFELTIKEQVGVVLHEMWHIALQHIWTIKKYNAHPYLANIAQDILINEGLLKTRKYRNTPINNNQPWFDLPPQCINVEWLENYLEKKLPKPWYKYNWYELYEFILENAPPATDEQSSLYIDGSYCPNGKGKEIKTPPNFEEDLIAGEIAQNNNEEAISEQMQQILWHNRIKNALATDTTGKLTENFEGLLPKVEKIDWYKLYQRYLINWSIRHELNISYQRLHRRYLSGTVPYIMPSVLRQKGLLPITVIFDTSASIQKENLMKFARYTDEFRNKFDLELEMWIIMVDCEVKECTQLESGHTLESYLKNKKIQFRGRGGTNFIPGLKKAYELRTKLCIYFTDLKGQWGERPKGMEVLWMVVNNETAKPNFGKIIHINN